MPPLRYCYQTIEFGETDIHLRTLRDNQEFHDPLARAEALGISSAQWPLFGIVWPSSLVLAHFLRDYPISSKRILEVGCGMALSSLLLNTRGADITATDYHPEAGEFLLNNTALNNGNPIAFERTGWADKKDSLGPFDLIVGSDLLYEDQQINLLADFIAAHAKQRCEVILVDPGRGRKNKLGRRLLSHGFSSSQQKPHQTNYLPSQFKGHILTFRR